MNRPTAAGKRMKNDLTRQQYLDLYYYMRLNRAVEDTMVKLFRQNKIVGGLYSSLGQEAISVGSAYASRTRSSTLPARRAVAAQAPATPRPCHGLSGRLWMPVVVWM